MGKRTWAPLQETCCYPIDLLQKPGVLKIGRRGATGRVETARILVGPYNYGTEEIDLGDIPQANPTPEDLQRNACEQARVSKVWKRKEGPAKFSLPLGTPAAHLPPAKTFGWKRIFNGKAAEHRTWEPTTPFRRAPRSWPSPTGRSRSRTTSSFRASPSSSITATVS